MPALGLVLFLLLSLATCAQAQWETVPEPNRDGAIHAFVRNATGAALTVYRDREDRVIATLTLGRGFDEFREDACPSFVVDQEPPVNLAREAPACTVNGAQARFHFGRVDGGSLISPLVLQLMNGRELTLRYPLKERGYRESRFLLRGSKQALSEALGPGVRVLGAAP